MQARGGGEGAPEAVTRRAEEGVRGSGRSYPHADRIQSSFGEHDLSPVKAHVGGEAARASEAIGAEAYASGEDVAFRTSPDLHTAAHEAAHVVQQRSGVSLPGGVGQAGDSYETQADSVADAVVRGESAEGLLGEPSGPGAASGVQRKDPASGRSGAPPEGPHAAHEVERGNTMWEISRAHGISLGALIEANPHIEDPNLIYPGDTIYVPEPESPGEAKGESESESEGGGEAETETETETGGQHLEFVEALRGAIGVGFLDRGIFQMVCDLPAEQRLEVWRELGEERRPLTEGLQPSSSQDPAILAELFEATPDSDLETLQNLLRIRFGIAFQASEHKKKKPEDWGANGLRQAWSVLEDLPAEHVEGNSLLETFERYEQSKKQKKKKSGAGGYWSPSRGGHVGMNYHEESVEERPNTSADPDDPLYGVNRFDKVARHEVGHAVDRESGYSDDYCVDGDNDAGGGWKRLDKGEIAKTLVEASSGFIENELGWFERIRVVAALQTVVDQRKPDEIDDRLAATGLDAEKLEAVKQDKAVQALRVCFTDDSPWYRQDEGGVPIGDRIYQEAYKNTWWSYSHAARDRKVSTYQFRAPGEWFAEAYATYYDPDGEKGSLLAGRDAATKQWFDANVDPEGGSSDDASS